MTILVSGGAGYIGSHIVRLLQERAEDVVVVDDFSNGRRAAVATVDCLQIDLAHQDAVPALSRAMDQRGVSAVIHLAARKQVGESVQRPTYYWDQNVGGLTHLLQAMEATGVQNLVFSSSAATYGAPATQTVHEDAQTRPINPYGRTKLVGEWMVRDAAATGVLRGVSLRYFNVAGAGWPDLGDPATMNLIPIVFEHMARGEQPTIFGQDYPTPDGTCIRDYIHVLDLAQAHLAALSYLEQPDRPFDVFNVGTGQGSSVHEVLNAIADASGEQLSPLVQARRAGDPPRLVADVQRIAETLQWQARHDLASIATSAWAAHLAQR